MVNKKIPLRKCVVTKEQHPKNEMFRIVRTNENEIIVDETANGKQKGHGAYLTKDLKVTYFFRTQSSYVNSEL